MTGEYDPGSNVRMARLMHEKIPASQLEILPGLRHSVLVEAPQLIAEKLDSFLR
jgi:pimeloyl-ACP methyl ester carboxylesterase